MPTVHTVSNPQPRDQWEIHLPEIAGCADVSSILPRLHPFAAGEIESIIFKSDRYTEIANLVPVQERTLFHNVMPQKEVDRLVNRCIIEECHNVPNIFECNVFTIEEAKKCRLRLIIEPRDLNKHFKYARVHLPNIIDIMNMVAASTWLYQLDLACFFYQIPLATEVRQFFGCRLNGKSYRLKCLPMGFVASVFVAQHLASILNSKTHPGSMNYIDNIFGGSSSKTKAQTELNNSLHTADTFNLKVKQNSIECEETLVVLGVTCNAKDKTISLAEEFVRKHYDILNTVSSTHTIIISVRAAMRITGLLCRVAYILRIPFYDLPNLLRISSELAYPPIKQIVRLVIPEEVRQLAAIAIRNDPVKIVLEPHLNNSNAIITDASRIGYGIIFIRENLVYSASGRWVEDIDNMPLLEARALLTGILVAERKRINLRGAIWFTDSKTVLDAAARGHSRCETINEAVRAYATLQLRGIHVPSAKNPADTMSKRGEGVLNQEDFKKLEDLCSLNRQ